MPSAAPGTQYIGTQLIALLNILSFSLAFRGGIEAAQWSPPQCLHGAEFPEPESRPQPAHNPCPGGAGSEERSCYRCSAGELAGLTSGQDVDRYGHLCHRPYLLPSDADLQSDSLELLQPRPQVRAGGSQTRWPAQVALAICGPQHNLNRKAARKTRSLASHSGCTSWP